MKNVIKIFFFLCCFCIGCEKGGESVFFENRVFFPAHGKFEIQPLLGESIVELTIYRSGYNTAKSTTVEVSADERLLDTYPDKQVLALPKSMYSIAQTNFTFEKDEVEKKVIIHLKKIDESVVGKNYILPIQVSADEQELVVEERSIVYLNINSYRNQYQGKYKVLGKTHLKYNEDEPENIDFTGLATTISPGAFQIPSHINGVNLWVEINGDVVKVKEANNRNTLRLNDLGSSKEGAFNVKYQRFLGIFNLSFSYEMGGRTHEAHMQLKFDL
ncbi:DUF1735 domain-containing protein [Sphingobacterium faecale]|uniref:DUF1735 domain-containing protein n=1 Tax=Sphingobacterium faecale TaxID=2803775 RepID=A0ABS1R0Q9_9SPHI|nr:DUF1735 domain-containing protein [Sphingobacterium faecale]MBL1408263.1 DUF1735 domain-containing protein [Sphingobacterium faecale]